jgi:hypothetical protein
VRADAHLVWQAVTMVGIVILYLWGRLCCCRTTYVRNRSPA